jgi:gluconolactonase
MLMPRRRFLVAGAASAAALPFARRARADWAPSERIPDARVQKLDDSFDRYWIKSAKVERLGTGFRWCEGPVWFGDGRYAVFSDIPNNRMMRWDEESGAITVYRRPSNYTNGNTRDRQGRLLSCEHGGRRVTRTEYDGAITVLADRFEGKPLNSPNDIVCRSDGSIWFSDPPFGILGHYEGHAAKPELPTNLYRLDGKTGKLTVVAGDINRPNGLAFSPDETKLYVIEAGVTPRAIHACDVAGGGTRLSGKRKLIDAGEGTPDGMRVDTDGNLWVGWGMGREGLDGVAVFNPSGKLIGRINLPERCANLCFVGAERNRLFMCATTSIYALYVNTQGARGG